MRTNNFAVKKNRDADETLYATRKKYVRKTYEEMIVFVNAITSTNCASFDERMEWKRQMNG